MTLFTPEIILPPLVGKFSNNAETPLITPLSPSANPFAKSEPSGRSPLMVFKASESPDFKPLINDCISPDL